MRILVLGAGGTGGYFGGRLAEAGADVSFLVRPARAKTIAERGLVIKSPVGDATLNVKTVSAENPGGPYDIVLLTCKAYDLDSAMDAITDGVGPNTTIVPLLNGLNHLDRLDAKFGAARVVGGLCQIGVALSQEGDIVHLDKLHALVFGERQGGTSARLDAFVASFKGAKADARQSPEIMLEMWEKFLFLCTLAAMSTLFRTTTGNILKTPDGTAILQECLAECRAVMEGSGFTPRAPYVERVTTMLLEPNAPRQGSMARDISRGNKVEADHVVGDMVARAKALGIKTPILRVAYTGLKAYEASRA
ncbi:MAG: 2-dehydropantoate 2-reductase [Rhodospirillales bacterium]